MLLPKLPEVNVLVSPLPPKVTLGDVVNVAALAMFCLFAVNVIEAGVTVPSWSILKDCAVEFNDMFCAFAPSLPAAPAGPVAPVAPS